MTAGTVAVQSATAAAGLLGCADVCAPAVVCPSAFDTEAKRFATLRARAALVGFTLCTITETDGECFYLLSRWGMSRTLSDLASVAVFLRKIGAPE